MVMMCPKHFYDYNTFLRRRFGEKVYKISLDAGFSCPNIDGTVATGGCSYCNQKSFSPAVRHGHRSLDEQIAAGMAVGEKFKARKFIGYLQAGSNTHAPVARLEKIYRQILQYPQIVGIAIGTRPDAVDQEKIALLQQLAKETFVAVEYGVQTRNDKILAAINRHHRYRDFVTAVALTRGRGIHICAHLLLGLPGDRREDILATANEMNILGIDGVKIHNLLITTDTPLAQTYSHAPFPLLDFEEYVAWVCNFIELLAPSIVVERLFATTPREYLIAPQWRKSPAQITDAIVGELKRRDSFQGKWFVERKEDKEHGE